MSTETVNTDVELNNGSTTGTTINQWYSSDNIVDSSKSDDDSDESDECGVKHLLHKNSPSFRCLAQIEVSNSSLLRAKLYKFPPLENPGIDEAFFFQESEKSYDNVGIEKYVDACTNLKIFPFGCVKRNLPQETLNLKYYGLTLKQMRAICDTLAGNAHVETIILEGNQLSNEQTEMLANMMEENSAIKYLNLRKCQIGPQGAKYLSSGVGAAQVLLELDISHNNLGDVGLSNLIEGLTLTSTLMVLNLSHNELTEACAETLEKVILQNNTLEELDLSWNFLNTGPACKRIFKAFRVKDTIKRLMLAWNGITTRLAVRPLAAYVSHSNVLEFLDLNFNRLTGPPLRRIRGAIMKSNSLVSVKIGNNPYTADEALFVASLLTAKVKDPLQYLDMENIWFTKDLLPNIACTMSDFSDLLQEAEKLTYELEGTTELPKVERSLKQVLEASNDLYTRVAQTGAKDIQANLLLGSKGIDLPKIAQKLESISTKRTFEPIQPVEDLDISNILENEIRNKILTAFDAGYNEMLESTFQTSWEHQEAEWKQEKWKILNAMGANSNLFIEMGKQSSLLMERPAPLIANLAPIETIYVSKIIEYNKSIGKGAHKQNLVNIFSSVANDFKDAKISDMWEIMKYMVQIPPFPLSENPIKTRYSKTFIEAIVTQGKRYLEDRYKTYMNNIINENLAQAGRGGIPGTYHLVRSFVGLRLQGEYLGLQDGVIDDRPLWPMVYYCLRSGDIGAAIHCLRKSGLPEYQEVISILETKLKYPNSAELVKLEDNLRFSYRRIVRNDTDPYKRIVWAVLGCCDVTDEHSEVARTADDYLWLKLNLVRDNSNKDDRIKYSDLQHIILEDYGEAHYDAFNQPHLYFQVLALTGQFEAAIEFLSRVEKFRVHAVHMAIALNELYILATPNDNSTPLIYIDPLDDKPARRLNLARLIMLYVRKFELTCPNESLNYFFLLRNYNDSNGQNLFKTSVSYLAIETKEYETILGKVQKNGIRTKGLIDQFSNINITAENIAQFIAENLVTKGVFEEAIDLYDIANNQDQVLSLLCSMLSRVAHLESEEGSLRNRLQEKAVLFGERFSREGYRSNANMVNSFLKLKEILFFFDQYHAKQYPQALKTLNDLQLVPLRVSEVDERVKIFKNYNSDVCKVIPDVLLATMNMLFAQYQKIKGNTEYVPRFHDETVEQQLKHLREKAKCLTNFTGMLPYRMPGDTNSRLIQMEILMH